jgi:hypothetical protein
MAEERSIADDAGTTVPKPRTAGPDRVEPPASRGKRSGARRTNATAGPKPAEPTKATKPTKAGEAATPAKPAKSGKPPTTPAKRAKAAPAKTAKAATPAKAAKAAPAKAAKATKATEPLEAAQAAKATKRSGPAKRTSAAKPATPPAGPVPESSAAAPGAWLAAGWEALWQPDQPLRLAALAVSELGPRAGTWVGGLRATYPGAPEHGIVRLAARQARRAGWTLAGTEAAGAVLAGLGLPATAWVRATLVLRIAATYGHDPTDPRRARELLELLADPTRTGETAGDPGQPAGLARVAVRLGLPGMALRRLLRSTPAGRALRALIAASDHGERIDQLAHRAARYYGHR